MSSTREKIEVMEAYERGESIEVRCHNGGWQSLDELEPDWCWDRQEYRVKPKLEIKAPMYYKTRDGLKAFVASKLGNPLGCEAMFVGFINCRLPPYGWDSDGKVRGDSKEHDLVEEWDG